MNKPILSVIIPCYNCERNVHSLINSLDCINNHKVEVVFIDDGSTDNTFTSINAEIEKYKASNFIVHSFDNSGAAVARERGLSLAKGEFIFFVDSDDYLENTAIDIVLKCCERGFDVLYFSSNISTSLPDGRLVKKHKIRITEFINFTSEQLILFLLKKNQWTSAVWTFVFKKSIWFESKAAFTNRPAHEDHLFTMEIIFGAKEIITIPNLIYNQVHTLGSLTNSRKGSDYIIERFFAYDEVFQRVVVNKSDELVLLYSKWSFISFLDLCIKNPYSSLKLLFRAEFWRLLYRYNGLIRKSFLLFLKSKLKKRVCDE